MGIFDFANANPALFIKLAICLMAEIGCLACLVDIGLQELNMRRALRVYRLALLEEKNEPLPKPIWR
jgi:hypothetical protein